MVNEPEYSKPYLWWPAFGSDPGPEGIPLGPSPEELQRERAAAAIRVRARRRIALVLGVYPGPEVELAPLLRVAKELEELRRLHAQSLLK